MSKVVIEIETDNAAFGDEPGVEVARILRDLATRIAEEHVADLPHGLRLRDLNGNTVGEVTWQSRAGNGPSLAEMLGVAQLTDTDTDYHVQIAEGIVVSVEKDDIVEGKPWSVIGDLRRPGSGFDDDGNYECRDWLDAQHTFANIDFDPETSCFYAYAETQAEADELVEGIKNWQAQR